MGNDDRQDKAMTGQAANTDRELYREPDKGNGSFYSDSIHVTEGGGIGINVGGHVIVMPLQSWHALATTPPAPQAGEIEVLTWAMCDAAGGAGKGKCDPENCACGPDARVTLKALHAAGFVLRKRDQSKIRRIEREPFVVREE